ncbi:hypothetical protein CXD82_06025 [Bordetella pertussis]|nr:hypothetical protein CXD82_06025 [Bordetella pertussis]
MKSGRSRSAPNWSTWPRNRSRPARNKQQPKGNGGASRHARQGRTTLQPNGRRPKAGVRFFFLPEPVPTGTGSPSHATNASCEDSIGCMHGSSEPDLRNWKSPIPQFTQGARPDEHP